MKSLALAIVLAATGCTLYFHGDDDCGIADDVAPPNELRDPATGQCETFGGGGCSDPCGVCNEIAAIPQPDWGSCFSQCEGLDENTCLGTPRCRAAYNANATIDVPPAFLQCWSIAPSGPATGTCDGLDAQECSRHDDCSAFYDLTDDGFMKFSSCHAEAGGQGCYGDQDCGPGAHCSTSDGDCQPPPGCDPNTDEACPAVCYGTCVGGGDACTGIDCGPGSHCSQECKDGQCGPVCVPDDTTCGPNSCPAGSMCVQTCNGQDPNNPGCGVCTVECVPSGTCETLGSEAECSGRSDCAPVYTGDDCTCDANGNCTCQILTYERCEKR